MSTYSSKIPKKFRKLIITHNFIRFLLIDRIIDKKDNLILITGKRGSGKSTCALKLILGFNNMKKLQKVYTDEVNQIFNEDKCDVLYDNTRIPELSLFDMDKDMVFQRSELQELCRDKSMGFILADEAVVNASRKQTLTRDNKKLHEIITINRKNYNTIIFCMPSIEDFDLSILQYVTHWIHIHDRGVACLFLPNKPSIFGKKSWDIDNMRKIHDKFLDDNPSAQSVPYDKFENFRGRIRFGALSKKQEENYLKIAHEKKNKDTENKNNEKSKSFKPKKNRLNENEENIIKSICTELTNGKIHKIEDAISLAKDLKMGRSKITKEVNDYLCVMGEGRTFAKILKDNKIKNENSYTELIKKSSVIY